MKQLTCEMCGSTDMLKQDGVFVCQSCGCKYSVEEAKKLIVDGVVEVKGTVEVDHSKRLDNLYQIARRARDDNNSENAAKYYEMILSEDPDSWEASFYSVYFKAMNCKIAQIQSAANSVSNCMGSVLSLVRDHVSGSREQLAAAGEILTRSVSISSMFYRGARNHFEDIDVGIQGRYREELMNNLYAACNIMYTLGDQIDWIFGNEDAYHPLAEEAWKNGVQMHKSMFTNGIQSKEPDNQVIAQYEKKIGKYNLSWYKNVEKEKLKKEIHRIEFTLSWGKTKKKIGWILCAVGVVLCLTTISQGVDLGFWGFYFVFFVGMYGISIIKNPKKS